MYRDTDTEKNYNPSLASNCGARYLLFAAVIIAIAITSIVVPLIIRYSWCLLISVERGADRAAVAQGKPASRLAGVPWQMPPDSQCRLPVGEHPAMGKIPERNAIREDVLYFALPAFLVYCAGLVLSAWHLVRHLESLFLLSIQSIVGLALIGAGLAIMFVSAHTLRDSYSSTLVVREDHQLVTHGVYGIIRHPIYLGGLMVCVGVPVFVSSVFGLLIMAALIPLILNRIRMEERMLGEEFGDAYRAYQESTRKLIPFIY